MSSVKFAQWIKMSQIQSLQNYNFERSKKHRNKLKSKYDYFFKGSQADLKRVIQQALPFSVKQRTRSYFGSIPVLEYSKTGTRLSFCIQKERCSKTRVLACPDNTFPSYEQKLKPFNNGYKSSIKKTGGRSAGFNFFLKRNNGFLLEPNNTKQWLSLKPVEEKEWSTLKKTIDISDTNFISPDLEHIGGTSHLTYSSEFYIPVQIIDQISKKMYLRWLLLADLPIQTKRGHFIINGYPKTVIHQIVRSPGIRFKNEDNQILADIISMRGAWMGIQIVYEKNIKAATFKSQNKITNKSALQYNPNNSAARPIPVENLININENKKGPAEKLLSNVNSSVSQWPWFTTTIRENKGSLRGKKNIGYLLPNRFKNFFSPKYQAVLIKDARCATPIIKSENIDNLPYPRLSLLRAKHENKIPLRDPLEKLRHWPGAFFYDIPTDSSNRQTHFHKKPLMQKIIQKPITNYEDKSVFLPIRNLDNKSMKILTPKSFKFPLNSIKESEKIHEALSINFFISSSRNDKTEKKRIKLSGFTFLDYLFDHPYFVYNNYIPSRQRSSFFPGVAQRASVSENFQTETPLLSKQVSTLFSMNYPHRVKKEAPEPTPIKIGNLLPGSPNKTLSRIDSASFLAKENYPLYFTTGDTLLKTLTWRFLKKRKQTHFFKIWPWLLQRSPLTIDPLPFHPITEHILFSLEKRSVKQQPKFEKTVSSNRLLASLVSILNTTNFRDVLFERFMNAKFYDIGLMGRKRLNKKLRLNIPLQCTTLTPLDFLAIFYKLFSLYNNFSLIQNFFPTEGITPLKIPFLGDSFALSPKINPWSYAKSEMHRSSGSVEFRQLMSMNIGGATLPLAVPGVGNLFKPRNNLLDNTLKQSGSLDHLNQRHIRTSGEFLFLQFWRAILRFYQVLSQLSNRSNFIKSSYTAAGKTGRNFFSLSSISLFPSSDIRNQTEYILPISNNQTHVLKAYGYFNPINSNDDGFNFNSYQYQCFQNTMSGDFTVNSNNTTLIPSRRTGSSSNNFRRETLNIVINRNDLNSILPYTPYFRTSFSYKQKTHKSLSLSFLPASRPILKKRGKNTDAPNTISTCAQFQNFALKQNEHDSKYAQYHRHRSRSGILLNKIDNRQNSYTKFKVDDFILMSPKSFMEKPRHRIDMRPPRGFLESFDTEFYKANLLAFRIFFNKDHSKPHKSWASKIKKGPAERLNSSGDMLLKLNMSQKPQVSPAIPVQVSSFQERYAKPLSGRWRERMKSNPVQSFPYSVSQEGLKNSVSNSFKKLNKSPRGATDDGGSKIETIIKKLLYETKELRVFDAKERMRNLETKLFNGVFKEFFNLDPLSQDLDETNGLSEIIHKRRISALGKGGVTSKNAPLSIRSIHPSFYGRLCPIDSPEGDRVGLINSLTNYARINSIGYIATPFYRTRHHDDLQPYVNRKHQKFSAQNDALSINYNSASFGHPLFEGRPTIDLRPPLPLIKKKTPELFRPSSTPNKDLSYFGYSAPIKIKGGSQVDASVFDATQKRPRYSKMQKFTQASSLFLYTKRETRPCFGYSKTGMLINQYYQKNIWPRFIRWFGDKNIKMNDSDNTKQLFFKKQNERTGILVSSLNQGEIGLLASSVYFNKQKTHPCLKPVLNTDAKKSRGRAAALQMRICPPIAFFGKIYNSYNVFPSLRLSSQDMINNFGKTEETIKWNSPKQSSSMIFQIGSTNMERTYKYFLKSSYLRPYQINNFSPQILLFKKRPIIGNSYIYRSSQTHFKSTGIHDFQKTLEPMPSFGLSKTQQRGPAYSDFIALPGNLKKSPAGADFSYTNESWITNKDNQKIPRKLELFLFYDTHYMTPPITHVRVGKVYTQIHDS